MKLPIPRGRRGIIVLGIPLGLAAAGAFVFMQLTAAAPPPVPGPAAGQHGPMLALDDRVINLAPTATGYKYAKVAVTVELRPSTAAFYALSGDARAKAETTELALHQEAVPLLLDALGQVVSAHDSSTLTSNQGRAELKTELLAAMRKVLGEREVLDVYLTDFVMQ